MIVRTVETVDAATFLTLSGQMSEGCVPTFEECKAYEKLKNNTEVVPVSKTASNLSHGYTRGTPYYVEEELRVMVYWPEINDCDEWPVSQLSY